MPRGPEEQVPDVTRPAGEPRELLRRERIERLRRNPPLDVDPRDVADAMLRRCGWLARPRSTPPRG